jgi:hypothetical protein
MKWMSIVAAVAFTVSIGGCAKQESDDLAKAQDCLDKVPQSNPSSATACLQYVAKYTSQQANILKCSIYMTSGGLVESKIVKAYNAVEDKSDNSREATFMSVLALDTPNVTDGYNTAVTADTYCQMTGVPGLQYLSGVVKIGSFMAKTIASYSTVDFSDTNAVKTAVNDLVTKCNTDPRPADCSTDLAAIGSSVTVLADGYCGSDNADSEVCENISAAVDSSGGNASEVGDALMCYLGNKTYNSTTKKCNP